MKKRTLFWIVPIAIIVVIMVLPGRNRVAPPTKAPPVNVSVEEITPQPQVIDSFDLPAVVEPNRVVRISAEVAGGIENLPLKKGSQVHPGDLLIRLNDDLLLPEFEGAQAQLNRDKIEYERMQNLVKENVSTQRDLDNATSQLALSKARLAEISARLARTKIVSPCSGLLNDLPVEEGEYVQVGNLLAELVDTDTVKVVVDVPERDIPHFAVGQKADVFAAVKGEEKQLPGTISFISKLSDIRTRSTRMEIRIDNKEGLLISGQIVRVRLTRQVLKDAIFIPLQAVIPMEEGKAVYVVNDANAHRRDVELGIIKCDKVQILKGLAAGDKLIIAGHRFISPGQNVQVITESK
jgi:membrane fusion protein (multidrug efflux system)